MNSNTIAPLRRFLLLLLATVATSSAWPQVPVHAVELVQQFRAERMFWKQKRIAEELVALRYAGVLPELEPLLATDDRHVRANVAFVFAALGDDRGFAVLRNMLDDFSERPIMQGVPTAKGGVKAQIEADRYYAIHILGDLKERRAVPFLVPLLKDKSIGYSVPWALAHIGDRAAIRPLIEATEDANPDLRVMAIGALVQLRAREALPRLYEMLSDNEKIHFDGLIPVSQAARDAITNLEAAR